jgi:hypothetical protein
MSVCFSSKNFPKGSLIYILDYLPIDDLAVSGRVSKIFLEASRNDKLCNKFYPLLKAEIQGYLRNNEEFPDRWPTQREICILAAKDVSSLFGPFLRNLGGMEWYLSLPRCQMNDQGRSGSSHIDYLTPRDLVDSTGKAHAVMRGFDHRRGLPAIGVVFEDGKKQHVQAFYPLRGQVFSCSNQQNRVRGVDASPGIDSHKLHAFSLQMKKMMEGRHLTTIIKQSPDVAQKHAQFLRETTRGAFSTALYLASPAFARNVRNHVLEYVGEFSGQEQKGYLNEALSVSDCPETLVDAVGIAHLLSFPLKAAKFGEEAGAIAVPAVGRIAHEGIDYSDQVFESAYGGIQDNLELDPRKTSDGITRIQGRYSEEGLLIKFQHKQTGRENVRFFYEQPRDYAENLFRCIGVEPEEAIPTEFGRNSGRDSSDDARNSSHAAYRPKSNDGRASAQRTSARCRNRS